MPARGASWHSQLLGEILEPSPDPGAQDPVREEVLDAVAMYQHACTMAFVIIS